MTTEENRLLIRHKIADFINNLCGGERFLCVFRSIRSRIGQTAIDSDAILQLMAQRHFSGGYVPAFHR
ncbi:hypothetical protein [Escherichia coli]|uniref:hypothetical protein n=1 Tax=Escherichia coli TaxID=562 RepID=UPI00202BB57C|nr:hypothetical protein [Escherichia coli]